MASEYVWHGDKWLLKAQKRTEQAVQDACIFYQRKLKEILSIFPGGQSPPGAPPGKVTGMLGRSMQTDFSELPMGRTTGIYRGRVGTNVPYAKTNEQGGKISAKPGKALPVPLNRKAQRMQAAVTKSGGGLRSLDLTFIDRSKKGKAPLLVQLVGKRNPRTEVLFILKKSVRIPRRPYMAPTLRMCRDDIVKRFVETLRKR